MGINKDYYPPQAMPWGMWSCPPPVEVMKEVIAYLSSSVITI